MSRYHKVPASVTKIPLLSSTGMPFPSYQSDLGQHEITDETGQPLLKESSFLVYNRANLHVLSLLCYYSHVSVQICDSFTGDDRLRHDKGFGSGFLPGHVLDMMF